MKPCPIALAGLLAGFTALAGCASGEPRPARPFRTLDLQLSDRSYSGDLAPVEDQTAYALEYVSESPGSAMGWGLGLSWSQDEGREEQPAGDVDVEARVAELWLGIYKSFDTSSAVWPYLGLGLSAVRAEVETSDASGKQSYDDVSPGWYLRAGVRFDLSDIVHLAVDLRRLYGTSLDLDPGRDEADFRQLSLVLGFSF